MKQNTLMLYVAYVKTVWRPPLLRGWKEFAAARSSYPNFKECCILN